MPAPASPPVAAVQTLLGFDFGEKRIGVAVGNTLTGVARPLLVLSEPTVDGRFARIAALLDEWQPTGLVVGRPLHPDGTPHAVTALAERFARRLAGRFGLPVALVDERYSSVAAQERLRADEDGWFDEDGHGALAAHDDGIGLAGREGHRRGRPRAARRRAGGGRRTAAGQGDDAMAAAIIVEQYMSETRT